MPVHDGMPFVEEAVASILAQSFTDFELVIGDNGSTDGTGEALELWARRDSRIRLLRRESKSGLAGGGNWVVAESRAPLVAIAHADDLSNPERLARQFELFEEDSKLDLIGTLWNGIDRDGRQVRPADYWRAFGNSPFAPFSHSSIMFRRSAFERAGGYRPQAEYWEDLDLYYRIAANGRVGVIPKPLATVRHADVSARLRNDPRRVEDAVDLMFRSTRSYRRGEDHSRLFDSPPDEDRPLDPMSFVSCGSTRLWSGESPATLKRMWQRGGVRLSPSGVKALIWVGWGTISPRSLRLFLRSLMGIRNMLARPLVERRRLIEWKPRSNRRRAEAQARLAVTK